MPELDILETAIYCKNLERAKIFYGEILSLKKHLEVENRHVFYRFANSMLLIFNPEMTVLPSNHPNAVPTHGAIGESHVCFQSTKLENWLSHLEDASVEIEKQITWANGARSIYFRDFEGNSLEIAEPKLWDFE